MPYTGAVEVGGPAQTRELPGLAITKLAVGPMNNNAYLLRCPATGQQLLIDAANEAERLLAEVGSGGLAEVVTTHRHGDHWQALSDVVIGTGARTSAHRIDAPELPLTVDRELEDGDTLEVGEARLRAVHLVGHTPGSVALVYEPHGAAPHVFTGDCLFPGGPGNTFGDSANFTRLMDDLEAKIFGKLPDETWVYPGHGGDTTLGAERPHLAQWRARGW